MYKMVYLMFVQKLQVGGSVFSLFCGVRPSLACSLPPFLPFCEVTPLIVSIAHVSLFICTQFRPLRV